MSARRNAWPEGVSDGLVERCRLCGERPQFDWRCDDETWRAVVPESVRLWVVCLPCFAQKASRRGIDVSERLEEVQFIGPGYTLVLRPDYIVEHVTAAIRKGGRNG